MMTMTGVERFLMFLLLSFVVVVVGRLDIYHFFGVIIGCDGGAQRSTSE